MKFDAAVVGLVLGGFVIVALAQQSAGQAGATTAPSVSAQVLKHGDGKADGKKSYGGSGEMIQFTMPEGYNMLTGIRIHGSRYGTPQAPKEDFMVYVMDEEHAKTLYTETAPYRLFDRGEEKWVTVKFKLPLQVTGTFWISLDFRAHQTKGVYVSYDTSTGGKYSLAGIPGIDSEPVDFKGDWMIQAMVSHK
jgi:RNA polymerase sigma-70 factor (ECF subfamily)